MTASSDSTSLPAKPDGRLPDFFIVGHHKCGTTALYEMLRRHPEIYMPDLKEPRFFESPAPGRLHWSRPERCPVTLTEYLALFTSARADQLAGEASPQYLPSLSAARLISEAQPEARIISIFREPTSFLRSLHMQLVQDHVESEPDLRIAIANEDLRSKGLMDWGATEGISRYSDHVKYVDQLRRYHAVFPREQVLTLIYDDFRKDNEVVLRHVLRFLELRDEVSLAPQESNPSVRVRSMRVERALSWLAAGHHPLAHAIKTAIVASLPKGLRGAPHALRERVAYAQPHPPEEALMRELRLRYRPEVVALSEYLDRDLISLWGYGDVR
jgi:hypothetical protein